MRFKAFFTKVFIDEDNELRVEHNRPFEMLLDPQVNANALTWAADANKARTSANVSAGKGSSLVRGVEVAGFEPASSRGEPGLLRAQLAERFLSPRTRASTLRTGSVP